MNSNIKASSFDEFENQYGENVLSSVFEIQSNNNVSDDELLDVEAPKIGMTWGEFKNKTFPKCERVVFGLGRGQIGMINASTNIGKTTFALNLALSLATGAKFQPFTEGQTSPLRIMIVDGENTQSELQYDLRTMMRDLPPIQQKLIEENLLLVCDEYINDEPLDLKKTAHIEAVIKQGTNFKPDLIIVDTMAALFSLNNENDNAEVKRLVMTPLKILGKEVNAAVLLLHHIGKQSEESLAKNAAYSGRGGSNFGALSRTVIKLSTPEKNDKSRVVFSIAKSKGFHLPDLMMKLDYESRWFSVSAEPPPKPVSSYDAVVKFVTKEVSTKEIVEHFEGKFGKRTIEDNLKQAVEYGAIKKVRQGRYAPIGSANSAEPISDSGKCGNENKFENRTPLQKRLDEMDVKEFERLTED